MKTRFLSRYVLNKEDQDRIVYIQETDDSIFSYLANHFIETKTLLSLKDDEVRKMVSDLKAPVEKILDSGNNLYWAISLLAHHPEDKPIDFIEDLQELYPNCIKNKDLLIKRMLKLSEISLSYIELFKIDEAKNEGLPFLDRTSTSVILKPVFEKRFSFGDVDIKDYKPNRIKKTPCAIIEFRNTYKKYYSFQVDNYQLEKLINELIALQIELKSFEDECN
jgi:hypothetical protein